MAGWDNGVYLIVEDLPVFATLIEQVLRSYLGSNVNVVRCRTYEEAEGHACNSNVKLVICGYGLGDGKTANDLRRICPAPMVIMTGRPGGVQAPDSAVVIEKNSGPERLRLAIASSLGQPAVSF